MTDYYRDTDGRYKNDPAFHGAVQMLMHVASTDRRRVSGGRCFGCALWEAKEQPVATGDPA